MLFKTASCRIEGFDRPGIGKTASKSRCGSFDYEPNRDGRYLYVAARACTADKPNLNYDMLPSSELRTAYKTFIGCPVFLNHLNDDTERARGVIIDAKWHDDNPDDQWVEILCELDEQRCPKLCSMIRDGSIDTMSMGCNVTTTTCSVCGNEAEFPYQFCEHVRDKGREYDGKLAYEVCNGIEFIEESFVYDPADRSARTVAFDDAGGLDSVVANVGPYDGCTMDEFYDEMRFV